MNFLLRLVLIALLPLHVIAAGLSSADYQAGIREATQRYRGDCVEGGIVSDRVFFYGSFTHDIRAKYLAVFAEFPFMRSLMDSVTSNHALQPTAPLRHALDVDLR